MNADSLITENNEKRKQLNNENKKIYEDMLIYIRLAYQKSEQETEEILMELLDHMLIMQEQGNDISGLVGEDPKQYADEIIDELPKSLTKKRVELLFMGLFHFFGVSMLFTGLIQSVMYYGFGRWEGTKTYYLGSGAVLSILSVGIVFAVVYFCIEYLKWTCFKNMNRILDFILSGFIFGILPFSVFLGIYYFMPEFGPSVTVPIYSLILIGILFLGVGIWLLKKGKRGRE
ncbi:DUF1129 family protein [Gracilibacillus kekensis]|uniref:DUF1129 family protein n=1 Tax=Gracilibacillus kekensis TaxID=1027249 RepID=A0A1M7QHJ6_9BACI|nr:DUF1129 family protein [Gracilibacillus kekensis]SHN30543.1 Protein of unknown function [Gracilibacillus kekensis]